MQKSLLILIFLFSFTTYSQDFGDLLTAGKGIAGNSTKDKIPKRWFSTAEAEFSVNYEVRYDFSRYAPNGNFISGGTTDLDNKASFGLLYSINYPVFNKFSVGALGGFQYQGQQKISALKVGGIFRYHYINYESVNINLMTAYNIGLSDKVKSDMANVRLGLQFPIVKNYGFNLNLNVFADYNYYVLDKPLLNETGEQGKNIIYRSYGVSLGFLF